MDFKVVAVGNQEVGKSCLIRSLAGRGFRNHYIPSTLECHLIPNINGRKICLWDTSGRDELIYCRQITYSLTDLFCFCFDLTNRRSFEDIETKWIPEIQSNYDHFNIALIGLKKDLRNNNNCSHVSSQEGQNLSERIHSIGYFEYASNSDDPQILINELINRTPPDSKCYNEKGIKKIIFKMRSRHPRLFF